MVKAKIEDIPFKYRGIEVTSENDDEKQHLENLWNLRAGALMLSRNDDGSVTITIGPTAEGYDEAEWEEVEVIT